MLTLQSAHKPVANIRDVSHGKCILAKDNGSGRKAVVWYSPGAGAQREVTYFNGEKMTYSGVEYFEREWKVIGPVMQMEQAFVVTAEQF